MKKTILVAMIILVSVQTLHAAVTIFESDATISASDTYDTVVVKGDDTVVTMTGGTVNKVITMDDSAFNMSGGDVTLFAAYDTSDPNIIGGNIIQQLGLYMQSSANISGNTTISYLLPYDSSVVNVSGNAAITNCWLRNNCIVNISGGVFQEQILGIGNVRVNLSGGIINASINIYSEFLPKPKFNIIGTGLEAKPYGGIYGVGEVTGFWNDGTPFTIGLGESYPQIVLYDGTVPPDCAFQPDSDLTGDCVVNVADLAKMAGDWLDDGRQ
ncbi:MAG: hypothetical protein KAJ07_04250 [Planctomycetes bacterium]|nr:hypothetical protein [Planctomycetota bacterium]